MTRKKEEKDKDAAAVQVTEKRGSGAMIKVRVKMAHEIRRVDEAGNVIGFWRYEPGQEIPIQESEFCDNLHERLTEEG